jgi:hypothetical protein
MTPEGYTCHVPHKALLKKAPEGLDVRYIGRPGRGLSTVSTAKTLRRSPAPATDAAKARQTREMEAAAPRWATLTVAAAGAGPTPLTKTLIYLWLFVVMLLAAGFVPLLVSLSALKSRALRRGVWFRVSPAARTLIDVALLEALRKAAEEVLRLTTPIRVLAKAVGYAVARQLGIEINEERATALGLRWLNTPKKWRKEVTTP